jgi:glycerol uptake facilitator-like aquaporin
MVFSQIINYSKQSLSQIGFGIFLLGISMAVGSLSDSKNLSEKDKKTFEKPKKIKMLSRSILSGAIGFLVMSAFFISIKYINPSLNPMRADQYSNLGFGCIALSLGLIFELKQMYEKLENYNLQKATE